MKTDEAGQQSFCELFEDLNAIQAAQSKDDNVGGGAAMVRGAHAAVRMAQIGLKRSKNIAQGGSGFSVKDFIRNLQAKFSSAADENADGSTLDWHKNSKVVLSNHLPVLPAEAAAAWDVVAAAGRSHTNLSTHLTNLLSVFAKFLFASLSSF